jgi:hypothetical protein
MPAAHRLASLHGRPAYENPQGRNRERRCRAFHGDLSAAAEGAEVKQCDQPGFRKCCRGATPSDYRVPCSGQPHIWLNSDARMDRVDANGGSRKTCPDVHILPAHPPYDSCWRSSDCAFFRQRRGGRSPPPCLRRSVRLLEIGILMSFRALLDAHKTSGGD